MRWIRLTGRWFVIAGLTRNPVVVWHWIPDPVRDDKLSVRHDKLSVRHDKPAGRVTFAEPSTAAPSAHTRLG